MDRVFVKTAVNIDDEAVLDILTTAFEGGIGYWCCAGLGDWEDEILEDGKIDLVLYEPIEEGGDDVARIGKLSVVSGIQRYIASSPKIAAEILVPSSEREGEWEVDPAEVDSEAADAIVQYAAFGEIVYS